MRSVSWLFAAKCFSDVPTPVLCTPSTMPMASCPAKYGSSDQNSNERPPSGFLLMFTPGPSSTATFSCTHSSPIATPTSRTSPGFQLLAIPAAGGKHVAGMECSISIDVLCAALRRPCGPSVIIYEVLSLRPFRCHASAPEVSAALFSRGSSCAGVVFCWDAWGIRLLSCASGTGNCVHVRGIA